MCSPLLGDFLIGKFTHFPKVHSIVNKIWALNDKAKMIDVYEVDSPQ